MAVQYNSEINKQGSLINNGYNTKKETVGVSSEANQFFNKYEKKGGDLSKKIINVSNIKGGFDNFIKQSNLTDESLIEFLKNTNYSAKDLTSYQQYISTEYSSITKNTGNILGSFNKGLSTVIKPVIEKIFNSIIEEVYDKVNEYINNQVYADKILEQKSKESFDKSSAKSEKYNQNIESLNNLEEKYKSIKQSESTNTDKKKELLNLQKEINTLHGTQSEDLDLVNGNFDEQLSNIKKIVKKEKKSAYYNSVGNYYNAEKVSNTIRNQEDDGVHDYVYSERYMNEDTLDVLENSGFHITKSDPNIFMQLIHGAFNTRHYAEVNTEYDENDNPLKTLEEKIAYLKRIQEALNKGGKKNSGLYFSVTSQIESWEEVLGNQKSAAIDLVDNFISYNADNSKVNSVYSFEKYRNELFEKAKNDPDIAKTIADGMLDDETLQAQIDIYMSTCTGFSSWYEKWKNNISSTSKTNKLTSTNMLTFSKAWDSLGTTGNDDVKNASQETKEQLLELAEAGKLTVKAFEDSTIAEQFMKDTGLSAEEATQKINALVDETKQLSVMRTGITAITSSYDEKKESKDNRVSTTTLSSLYDNLGVESWSDKNDISNWEKYKDIASSSKSTLKELKEAQDDLASSFVNSNNFLSNLDETNEGYYKNLLKEMGVANADVVVNEMLASQKEFHALKAEALAAAQSDVGDKTNDASTKFLEEAGCSYAAQIALADYVAQETIFNNSNLNVDDKVTALEDLIESYYGAAAAASFKNKVETSAEGALYGGGTISPEEAFKQIQEEYGKIKPVKVKIKTTKGNKSDDKKEDANKTKESKQEIDWLERRLTRMQSIIDLTASKLQNLFSVKKKNNNLDKQIKQSTTLMKQYGIAADTYTKKANKVAKASGKGKNKVPALSKDIISKVKSGKITKASYSKLIKKYGQSYADKINSYINYYDKAQDAKKNKEDQIAKIRSLEEEKLQNQVDDYNAKATLAETRAGNAVGYAEKNSYIKTQLSYLEKSYKKQIDIAKLTDDTTEQERLQVELEEKKVELKQQQIDNLKKEYENKIGVIDNGKQNMDNQVSKVEARGQIVQSSYYSSLNQYENQKLSTLNDELAKLQAQQNTFVKNSQEWYDLQSDIQSTKNAINDAEIAIIENNKKIGELRQAMYDDIASRNSDVSTEANFLAGLLGDNLTNEKTGDLTKEGLAVLGTYGIDMEANASTALSYKKEREEIEKAIASYKKGNAHALDSYGSLEAAEKKLSEVIQKQQDAISAEYANEKQIYDLMTQKYETQLSYLKSIIDAKKQVLDMEKDLYDYQKNIASQTKNIATLEKQLAALQGDDSEEGRARKAKIQLQLDEANEELQDTEYERYISDQQNMLDNLYSQYEDLIQELEKNFEAVVKEGVNLINGKSGEISETLSSYAKNYGYNPSTDMSYVLTSLLRIDENGSAIRTLPETTKTGFSKLGQTFNNFSQEVIKLYNNCFNSGNDGSGSNIPKEAKDAGARPSPDGSYGTPNRNSGSSNSNLTDDDLTKFLSKFSGTKDDINKPLIEAEEGKSYKNALNKRLSNYGYVVKTGTGSGGMSYINLFARNLGLANGDGSFDENGKVYNELRHKYPGFQTGGIVRSNAPETGDNVWVRVNPNETVLTQKFTDMLPYTVDIMDNLTKAINLPDYSKIVPNHIGNSQSFGDINLQLDLPNVQNAQDFVSALQNDKKVQQAFTIATKDLVTKGRITNNIKSVR